IIGTLIGTGIFASPGPLFDSVNCTQTSFMIWAFAGIVCIIGAFAYAELGTMFPESGGDYQYLARAYSKKVALVFGWSFITILNPIGTAGIAGVLGRYTVDVIHYLQTGTSMGGHDDSSVWMIRGFSIGAILIMGLINIFFREGGKYASNILAIIKIAGMCMLIVIGSMQAIKNHAQSEALSIPIRETSHDVLDYVSALCFAFFAYNGFNNINLGLGELRDPERNLKRAVWIAMPFVTILFLLANFAFFSILSSYDLRHVHSLSLHAGHTVLGQPGGFLMAFTVIASALGSINANLWAGSRLLVIMAKDNAIIPLPVGKVWQRTGTQAFALVILMAQASFHAMLNLDFKTFSKIYSAVGWSWYGLSILGLLWLRRTKPSFPRPVKVFWPLALAFVLVAFFLVFGSL
ncbi:amino acid/polyamine transporter I, partial [Mortierella sp. GBAus27b]